MSVTTVLIIFSGLLMLLSLWPLYRGFKPRRVGDIPTCRRCKYVLSGLDLTLEDARCPECGTAMTHANVRRGRRRVEIPAILFGVLILTGGIGVAWGPISSLTTGIKWYHYRPTNWVMRDLNDAVLRPAAWEELDRRDKLKQLSGEQLERLSDWATNRVPCVEPYCYRRKNSTLLMDMKNPATIRAAADVLLSRLPDHLSLDESRACADDALAIAPRRNSTTQAARWHNFIAENLCRRLAYFDRLTPAQAARYFEGISLDLDAPPFVAESESQNITMAIELDFREPRVWAELSATIDGVSAKITLPPGTPPWWGCMSGDKAIVGCPEHSAIQQVNYLLSSRRLSVGTHTIEVRGRVFDGDIWWQTGKRVVGSSAPITASCNFQVTNNAPIPARHDSKSEPPIDEPNCFVATNNCYQSQRLLDCHIAFSALSTAVAFDVFLEVNGQEYYLGEVSGPPLPRFRSPQLQGPSLSIPMPPIDLPKTVDLVLRSSTTAARHTTDIHDIWDGETKFPVKVLHRNHLNWGQGDLSQDYSE